MNRRLKAFLTTICCRKKSVNPHHKVSAYAPLRRQRFSGRVLPISTEICLAWGMIAGKAEAVGRPIPIIDGLLGATAVVHRLTVVTRNENDIVAAGASVFNPWSG